MIKGTYSIYKNGVLEAVKDNVITDFGKDIIWKFLCGTVPDWGGAIALGTGSSTALATNTKLDFEFARNVTLLKSPQLSGSNRVIILKTSLEPNIVGVIKEIGIYNTLGPTNQATFDGRILSQFGEGVNLSGESDPLEWSYASNVSVNTANSKIGSHNIMLDGTSSSASTTLGGSDTSKAGSLSINLTKYSPLDTFEIAYDLLTAVATTGKTLKVTLYDDQQTPAYISKTWTFANPTSTGYGIKSATFSEFTADSGTFNYNVSAIKIETNMNISLDAMRVDDTDSTDVTYGLVSRAVLTDAITKKSGDSIDIEYKLTLGWS